MKDPHIAVERILWHHDLICPWNHRRAEASRAADSGRGEQSACRALIKPEETF